jgi:predicted RND superfamily exporter protein
MNKYIDFLDKYKYAILISTTLIVLLFSFSLKNIAFEGSYRIWFDKNSQIMTSYDKFRSTFSGDDTFIVSFKDEKGIFNKKAIETIISLTNEFKKIAGVQKVDSLTNYQYISSEDDDIIVEDFFYEAKNLKLKEQIALKDKLILNQLISKDGKTTLLALRLASFLGADEELNIKVMKQIEKITTKFEKETSYKFYISGAPAITASLVTIAQKDALVLIPLAVVLVVFLLFIFFRNFLGVIVPSIVIVYTFLLTLSIQFILGYSLNNFTVNIPSFVSAIAIADSMHLYLAWVYYRQKEMPNKEALAKALSTNIIPIAMTSFTTAIGFATLGISHIVPISTLGISITSAALLAFIFSISLAPAIMLMFNNQDIKPIRFFNFLNTKGYGAFIKKNDIKIVVIFFTLFIVLLYGLSFVKVDSNIIKYFKKDTVVRQGSDFVEKNLTGSMIYEVIVDSKVKEGIKNPVFLKKIVKFEEELKQNFKNITFITSIKDIVIRMQHVLNKDIKEDIPNTNKLVAQYILLYSMSLPQGMEINDKIDTNERFLRISINSNIQDTSKDIYMIDWIKNWWKQNTNYSADVQGQTTIFAYMQKSVTDTLIYSVLLTLIIVCFAMLFIFRKVSILLLFILPNIAPILLVGGVMGYLNINIDIGVAISAAVILGIAVDDTIHFFSKYFESIKLRNFEHSIDYVISHSGNAMILTTFILSITFAIFGLSSFVPNVNFAIVTIIALNLALLLDLVLLPALLSLFHYKKRQKFDNI